MSDIFFTSDSHLGHANIIKYCNRPFKNTDEMDEALIKNWNVKVKPNDKVYFMGDFTFNNPAKYRARLNGDIFFIRGNHDSTSEEFFRRVGAGQHSFQWMRDVHNLKVGSQEIWLSHYAHRVWPKSGRGAWMLCGHSHGTCKEILPEATDGMILDVGVDVHNYTPLSFDELKAIMLTKGISKYDHH